MQQRWYDLDPTVSLAVSLMKSANEETQLHCAEYIISKSRNLGVKNKENALNEAFTYLMKRWYDKDKRIQEAFEYLKSAPSDIQRAIALGLIDALQAG